MKNPSEEPEIDSAGFDKYGLNHYQPNKDYNREYAKSLPRYGTPEFKLWQYEKMKESRRGHNYAYLTDEIFEDLEKKGYQRYLFKESIQGDETLLETLAQDVVKKLREEGNYARIFCVSNSLRVKTFMVYYKKK